MAYTKDAREDGASACEAGQISPRVQRECFAVGHTLKASWRKCHLSLVVQDGGEDGSTSTLAKSCGLGR